MRIKLRAMNLHNSFFSVALFWMDHNGSSSDLTRWDYQCSPSPWSLRPYQRAPADRHRLPSGFIVAFFFLSCFTLIDQIINLLELWRRLRWTEEKIWPTMARVHAQRCPSHLGWIMRGIPQILIIFVHIQLKSKTIAFLSYNTEDEPQG